MSTNSTTTVDLNQSRAGKVATVIILCPALATVCVALRVYTRFVLGRKRLLEDYFIVLAMLFSTATSVCMGISVLNGFGRHIQTVTREEITMQLKVAIGAIQFYMYTHLFVKLSIMLQYTRISVMPFEKRLCYVIISFLVLQSISSSIVHFNLCSPFEALWNRRLPGTKCLNTTAVYNAQLSLTIATDFAILIIPAPILKHLTLRWHQKLAITIALSFGSLACVVSILRLTSIRASTQSKDITWDKVYSAYYAAIEINTGIICSCIVTLKPLLQRHFSFVGRWLDALYDRSMALNSWKSHIGQAPAPPRSSTTEGIDELKSATEVELATVKGASNVLEV